MCSSHGWPFDTTTPLDRVHEQDTVSSLAEEVFQTLVASVSPHIYHVEKMLQTDQLLAKSGLIPTPYKGNEKWSIFTTTCIFYSNYLFSNFQILTPVFALFSQVQSCSDLSTRSFSPRTNLLIRLDQSGGDGQHHLSAVLKLLLGPFHQHALLGLPALWWTFRIRLAQPVPPARPRREKARKMSRVPLCIAGGVPIPKRRKETSLEIPVVLPV